MLKGVLLDVDGTLVLSNDAHAKAWQEAFEEYGHRVEFEKIRRLIGMGGDKLLAETVPGLSDESGEGKAIKDRRQEIFLDKYAGELKPTPGSRQLVEALRFLGLRTVVASSASEKELSSLLKAANVADILTQATTSDDAENSKPEPDIVEVALQKIGLSPDEVLMLGDTPYDIEAATKANVKCVAVRTGGWKDTDLAGAIKIYDSPADLLAHRQDFGY